MPPGRLLGRVPDALPLVGAAPRDVLARAAAPTRLVRRYGTEAATVSALRESHPDLAVPVSDACPTLGLEFLFGVLHEGAMVVEDLLERRTRVAFDEAALPAARELAERALDRADRSSGLKLSRHARGPMAG